VLSKPPSRGQTPTSPRAASHAFQQEYLTAWAIRFQQNLPPQVLLRDPVVLYDALDRCIPIFLEWITCPEVNTKPRLQR